VPGAVLAEGHVAIHQRGFDRGKLCGSHVLLAQQFVHRARTGGGQEHALGVLPSVAVSGAPLMNTGRGAHMAISSWESTGRSFQFSGPAYLRKLPAIQWYSLAAATFSTISPPIAAVQFGPAFARGADVSGPEALIVRHGDEGCLAITGVTLQGDMPGVHGFIRFEIIEGAAGAPGPRAQGAPIVRLAGTGPCCTGR